MHSRDVHPVRDLSGRQAWYRYCQNCGWGFHRAAWSQARYCPRCGIAMKPHTTHRANSQVPSADPDLIRVPRRDLQPMPTPASFGHGANATNLSGWICAQPIVAGTCIAAAGAGLILAGPVLAATGSALAALGMSITSGSTVLGLMSLFMGVLAKSARVAAAGMALALGGSLVGAAVTLIGGIVMAAGAFLTGTGWVLLAAGLLLLVLRTGARVYQHRQAIVSLVQRLRSGTRSQPATLATGKEPASVESLLLQVEAELARSRPGRS